MAAETKRRIFKVREGRYLFWPREVVVGRDNLWARPGEFVDLTHPKLFELARSQASNKLEQHKGRVPKAAKVVGEESWPRFVKGLVSEYDARVRGEDLPDEDEALERELVDQEELAGVEDEDEDEALETPQEA